MTNPALLSSEQLLPWLTHHNSLGSPVSFQHCGFLCNDCLKPFAFVSDAFPCVSFQILAGKILLLVLPHPSVPYGVETLH